MTHLFAHRLCTAVGRTLKTFLSGYFVVALGMIVMSGACVHGAKQPAVLKPATMASENPLIDAKLYPQTCNQQVQTARQMLVALEQVQAPWTIETVLVPLNALWRVLDQGLSVAGLYRNVHPDESVRQAASHCEQELQKVATDLGLSQPIFQALQQVPESQDTITQRVIAHTLRDFRRAGVNKDAKQRDAIRQLKQELVQIGQVFDKNIRDDVRYVQIPASALAGLPEDYKKAHAPDHAGFVKISTETPDYMPFMSYAKDDGARLNLYTAFRQRGFPANRSVLQDMLQKRSALAHLLGYANYADFVTADKMIKSGAHASEFIERITQLAAPRAARDYQQLLDELKQLQPQAQQVGDWQKAFLEERVKRQSYAYDAQKARSFFPFAKVRQGVLDTTAQMFGVSYKKIDVPVWHPSVTAYEISDHNQVLGRFYLDLQPRANKYQHAAAFPIRAGLAGVQLPEAALVCNFAAGDDGLMEHQDVETFFHEFGHLLHHLFAGKQQWIPTSGIATEWDFVEAPSQMLEEWSYDAKTLKRFAKNKEGKSIDDALIEAMRRARDFGKGIWVRHQMFYAAISLQLHQLDPKDLDTDKLVQALQERYSAFDYVHGTHFQYSFGHLEGYSALYYTYMWSLVIAKDLFSVFEAPQLKDGLCNQEVAQKYRRLVLEPGGARDAAQLISDFLGRDFAFDAFDRWLNAD